MSHSSEDLLKQALDKVSQEVRVGGVYVHYKDPTKMYEVLALAISESDEAVEIVYNALYGKHLVFTRPMSSWCDDIEVNGAVTKRFVLAK